MSHIVKYKLFPNQNDPYLPECYANAYHYAVEQIEIGSSPKKLPKVWERITGTKLEMNTVWFKVTFPSEADELLFRLRWS